MPIALTPIENRQLKIENSSTLFLSLAEPQQAGADADGVAVVEWGRPLNAELVDKRPARRIGVLQDVTVVPHSDAGVHLLDALLAEQADVAALRSANRRLVFAQHHLSSGPASDLNGNPRLLEEDLRQRHHQADA